MYLNSNNYIETNILASANGGGAGSPNTGGGGSGGYADLNGYMHGVY